MDTSRALLTLFAAVAVVAVVGWTMALRRAHEAERSQAAAEVARLHATVRDLGAQLQAAGRGLRRLRALEGLPARVRALIGW